MPDLTFARGLHLPVDAVTQTFGLLAKRGAGKSYAAMRMAESMLEAHAQIVAVDPVGSWFSLRLDADGKRPGYQIPVFGGLHGDLPLEPQAGKLIADLVVEREISAVLDVSLMRKNERKQFVTEFAEQLFYRKKQQRSPIHIFVEESQVFVPQRTMRGEERMLGAFEDLIKLGRNFGIGATLISQRPQSVNKDALNQTECLIVLQTIGAQERKALQAWMREHDQDRQDVIDALPSLEIGEAYVWSPGWLRTFKRIRISKRKTFDASATPKMGGRPVRPRELAKLDLEEIRGQMAEVVERAEQNDPAALKRRIVGLERELAKERRSKGQPSAEQLDDARADGARAAQQQTADLIRRLTGRDTRAAEVLDRALGDLKTLGDLLREPLDVEIPSFEPRDHSGRALIRAIAAKPSLPQRNPRRVSGKSDPHSSVSLGGGCGRMLRVLAQRSPIRLTEAQWATLSKLKRTGGTWTTYKSRLRLAGYVIDDAGLFWATDEGLAAAGQIPPAPSTTEELVEMWRGAVGRKPGEMLDVLVEIYPRALSRVELAERVELEVSGGTFTTYMSRLRSNGLIEIQGQEISASSTLFELA